jgi:hypothetical protein
LDLKTVLVGRQASQPSKYYFYDKKGEKVSGFEQYHSRKKLLQILEQLNYNPQCDPQIAYHFTIVSEN